MRFRNLGFIAAAVLISALGYIPAMAQVPKADDAAAIKAVMEAQVAAWNKGDIPGFMASYEDSPETTFVGATTVNKGFQPILERYKRN